MSVRLSDGALIHVNPMSQAGTPDIHCLGAGRTKGFGEEAHRHCDLSLLPAGPCDIVNAQASTTLYWKAQKEFIMTGKSNPRDKQVPGSGKVENDTNKMGEQVPTQLNQGKRTPVSRSDRESHVGGSNQSQLRRAPPGATRH